ncbi:hypothetical protein RirG_110650 [Rhizophagus irregularis DAOM 197198w]|uniref:Zinc finger mym-type protein 2-like n=1 Tax=Rhizophagus irregularis (strain DAOM 197198w) TaxID=1432141 RepID=A0A015L5P6_RHIIW|nr:hypothetical protein RirG_110650 [Rhizophagus irregularis DAOM 197198w]
MENIKESYFKPTAKELLKVQESHVPQNTVKCTKKWINILNSWRNHEDVGYKYTLESLSSNQQIEKEMCEFIYGIRTKSGERYSRASLKNAVASISRHLKDTIPQWNYNLLDKNHFPKLHATLDGTLKEMKKLGIGAAKPHEGLTNDELKIILDHDAVSFNNPEGLLRRVFLWICLLGCPRGGEHYNLLINQFEDTDNGFIFKKFHQKNDQGGLESNQYTFEIPFPSDVKGKAEPNADIRKYISMRPSDCITKEFYLGISTNTAAISKGKWYYDWALGEKRIRGMFREICIACGIDISGRNISNHSGRDTAIQSIFDAGNEEVEAMAISGHNSSAGVRNYLKVTKEKKRKILGSVMQRLTEDTSDINSKTEIQYDNEVQCDDNMQHGEIVLSGFSKASELLENKNKRPLQETSTNKNIDINNNKKKKRKKIIINKYYYNNCSIYNN